MRKSLPFFFLLFFICTGAAAQRPCYSAAYAAELLNSFPNLTSQRAAIENFTREIILKRKLNATVTPETPDNPTIYIPVVVHILYNSVQQNISDAQVISQIDVLNADYSRLNADTVKTPAAFRSVAASAHLRFILAGIDPQGQKTSGIIRKQTNRSSFGTNDDIKFSQKGGDDGWNPDQYLNIWVGNLAGGYIGYASVVGGPRDRDGVVILFTAFGTKGVLAAPYNKGRTATHEIGHWLNLMHIWGDTDCGNDQVEDTPPQQTSSRGCPEGVVLSCTNTPNGNMYSNFMDFTDDQCMNIFTKGQCERMLAMFAPGGPRHAMLESPAINASAISTATQSTGDGVFPSALTLYPNPASSMVKFVFNTQVVPGTRLDLFSLDGRRVLTINVTQQQQEINISSLKPGVYLVKPSGTVSALVSRLVKL